MAARPLPLPVPRLGDTLARLSRSLRPLAESETQLKTAQDHIQRFSQNLGPRLQRRLIDHQSHHSDNWLDAWWLKYAYLSWRNPVMIDSNWYMLMRDDPVIQSLAKSNTNHTALGGFTSLQIKRAARYLNGMLDVADHLRNGTFPVERFKDGSPMSMEKYGWVFGVTRIPRPGCDELIGGDGKGLHASHIVVSARDHWFKVPVYVHASQGEPGASWFEKMDTSGWMKRLGDADIEQQLWKVVDMALASPSVTDSISLLTGDDRDNWADVRFFSFICLFNSI